MTRGPGWKATTRDGLPTCERERFRPKHCLRTYRRSAIRVLGRPSLPAKFASGETAARANVDSQQHGRSDAASERADRHPVERRAWKSPPSMSQKSSLADSETSGANPCQILAHEGRRGHFFRGRL